MLDIEVEQSTDYTLCRPVGELDAYTVSQFREALGGLASKPYLLIDLSAVPFMDSAGLGALIGGIRRTRELGPAGGPRPGRSHRAARARAVGRRRAAPNRAARRRMGPARPRQP